MKFEVLNSLFSKENAESALSKVQLQTIENFDKIIQSVRPLNSRQMQSLPDNIAALSHQLTDERGSRRLGYMNENVQLSAYVRYFTWWNLVRLTRLFSNLPAEVFPSEDCACLDLGSGPLTLVTALWISRPELRNKNLTWYCLDLSQSALTLGEELYMSVAAQLPPSDENALSHWKIIRVKGSFGTFIKEKCSFVTCANMFNELDQGAKMPPEFQSKKYFDQLSAYAAENAKFLLVEPGVPKAARTLSLLRERFIKAGFEVKAPCPHAFECPMNGFKSYTGSKNKWCNFAFSTEDAPARLQKLSVAAKLPKERAVLSFISAVKAGSKNAEVNTSKDKSLLLRITSDSFRLPKNRTGYYACSRLGLTLVSSEQGNCFKSGDLIKSELTKSVENLPVDYKSGAKIVHL
ncbi:MAG: small ribosomal subunit Rsm22 family protein [Treponema sp.]|nr:small ribosomal subunit Rsm22 family protein [Treponema sp.]